MFEASKIRLSADELRVLGERDFFVIKKRATEKIYHQFAELVKETQELKIFSDISFPPATDTTTGKISKGENYAGFPYVLLDFPRRFSHEEIIAVRTMAWWGNFISSTLLISGTHVENSIRAVIKNLSVLKEKNAWLCIHDSPWHHHFEKDNYIPLKNIDRKEAAAILGKIPFLKLSRKIPVRQINRMIPFARESFKVYAKILRG